MSSLEKIAKVAHEINRAYCEAIGDTSQDSWENAQDWQKASCVESVKKHIENPLMTPEMSHNSWMEDKKNNGWRYGPTKDSEKKQHPCMVEYNLLPIEERVKDHLFSRVVEVLGN